MSPAMGLGSAGVPTALAANHDRTAFPQNCPRPGLARSSCLSFNVSDARLVHSSYEGTASETSVVP